MPIDVQDPALNIILNACLLGLVLLTLLSLIPWRTRRRRNRWTLWLPVAALALYAVYEIAMPARMDIRLDLLLIGPLLIAIFGTWLVRIVFRRRVR